MTPLLSIRDAAARLGIKKDLLYKLVSLDEFPYIKIGSRIRIIETDIDRWIAANKRGPACFKDSAGTELQKERIQ